MRRHRRAERVVLTCRPQRTLLMPALDTSVARPSDPTTPSSLEGQGSRPEPGAAVRYSQAGFLEPDRKETEVLFRVLIKRDQKSSVATARRSGTTCPRPSRGGGLEQSDRQARPGPFTGPDPQIQQRFPTQLAEHQTVGRLPAAVTGHQVGGDRWFQPDRK